MALQEEFESQGNFLFKYRGQLPVVIVFTALFVFIFSRIFKETNSFLPYTLIQYISLSVSFVGLWIRIITVGHTPVNTSGRNTATQTADQVNTSGIYSTVRHPLYLGNFFMWLGAAILVDNIWFDFIFVLLYWVYYERIMYAEEQFLRRKFNTIYTDWAAQTPAFIPALNKYSSPKYPFSLKKVLRKEKNGLLAIFVLLFLFDTLNRSLVLSKIAVELNWISVALIVSLLSYFVIKILHKSTSIFKESGR